jgi:cyclopropane fatty-acyl-phospholipid synthase-like methyltransferase
MARRAFFTLQYWIMDPPWDTGVTPPEVYRFLEKHPPGKALDLGCGTGTNVITLAEHGWRASGVDYVPRAIRIARRKARRKDVSEKVEFFVGNALSRNSFQGKYDLILDIGCFHIFLEEDAETYARNAFDHLVEGGRLLMYAHLHQGPGHGATETGLATLGEYLELVDRVDGEESSRPSAWLEFVKAASRPTWDR